jgi:cytochrome oxidase Cu insertion factor (SCO1/SenC/PrrC family)
MTRRTAAALSAFAILAAVITGGVLAAFGPASDDEAKPPLTGEGRYRGSEPPPGIRLPSFSLWDVVRGERVESQTLRGSVVLVTFLDTDCTEQCPIIAGEVGRALSLLSTDERGRTQPLVISVNPQIDTRASVVRFLRERRAESLTYLSGTVAELRPVWHDFGVVSAYETGDADTHSADVRVFDPEGIWVSTEHAGVDLTPANLAYDVSVALRGGNG